MDRRQADGQTGRHTALQIHTPSYRDPTTVPSCTRTHTQVHLQTSSVLYLLTSPTSGPAFLSPLCWVDDCLPTAGYIDSLTLTLSSPSPLHKDTHYQRRRLF
ncbi:unnamed protein product [Periconia digitata]|uniref:Uncharacterized protein n=1 Tax=Periconia digitata TaxID=1303443 RepID=A0A9W4U2K3_9PLEO|nr:unnamed protein product [Periconia digitata]